MFVNFGLISIFGALRLVQLCLQARKTMAPALLRQTASCAVVGAASFLFGFLIWNLDKFVSSRSQGAQFKCFV